MATTAVEHENAVQTVGSELIRISDPISEPDKPLGERTWKTAGAGVLPGPESHRFDFEDAENPIDEIYIDDSPGFIKALTFICRNGARISKGAPAEGSTPKVWNLMGKRIERLWLYRSNFQGGRCGGMKLQFSDGSTETAGNVSTVPEVRDEHGGQLIGAYGNSGADIDGLGFYLGELPASYRFVIDPATWKVHDPEVKSVTQIKGSWNNCGTDGSHVKQAFTYEYTESRSYTGGFKLSLGAKVKFKAGVPILGTGGSWEVSFGAETSHEWGKVDEIKDAYITHLEFDVPADKKIILEAILIEGTVTVGGKVQVIATYEDGTEAIFDEQDFEVHDSNVFDCTFKRREESCPSPS